MSAIPKHDPTVSEHPGTLLRRDVLPGLGMSITQAAADLKVTRQTLHRILAGTTAITLEMALRLEQLTGVTAETWLGLQEIYDLGHARSAHTFDVSQIPHRALPAALVEIVERHARTIWENRIIERPPLQPTPVSLR
jgi:addiction module HigA family antidote